MGLVFNATNAQTSLNTVKKVVPMPSLRNRIEHSKTLAAILGGVANGYLSLCDKTTRWQIEGRDALTSALAQGPVMLVMWHERSIMGAVHWPVGAGPLSSLYDASPIGRVSGALQRQRGLQPIEMSDKTSNIAASRSVLRRFKDGVSIGMTGDGPLGPARQMKSAPLEWARAGQMPVFGYAFASTRSKQLDTWDNMHLPLPFGRGAIVFDQFSEVIARRPDEGEAEAQAQALATFLDGVTARADGLVA